jgi:hypothetical protein
VYLYEYHLPECSRKIFISFSNAICTFCNWTPDVELVINEFTELFPFINATCEFGNLQEESNAWNIDTGNETRKLSTAFQIWCTFVESETYCPTSYCIKWQYYFRCFVKCSPYGNILEMKVLDFNKMYILYVTWLFSTRFLRKAMKSYFGWIQTEMKLWKPTKQIASSKHFLVSWILSEAKHINEETEFAVMHPFCAFVAKDVQ